MQNKWHRLQEQRPYFIILSVKYNYLSPMCNFTQEVSIQFTVNIHIQFHTTPYPDITSTYFQRPILLGFHFLRIRPSEWVPSMQSLNQNLICLSFPASIHVICTTYLNWQADTLINVAFTMLKLYKISHEIFLIFKLLKNCKCFFQHKMSREASRSWQSPFEVPNCRPCKGHKETNMFPY